MALCLPEPRYDEATRAKLARVDAALEKDEGLERFGMNTLKLALSARGCDAELEQMRAAAAPPSSPRGRPRQRAPMTEGASLSTGDGKLGESAAASPRSRHNNDAMGAPLSSSPRVRGAMGGLGTLQALLLLPPPPPPPTQVPSASPAPELALRGARAALA